MQQEMFDPSWESKTKVGKLYVNRRDYRAVPEFLIESLMYWVDPDEEEDAKRDEERERETREKLQRLLKQHKGETWCFTLQRWLKPTDKVSLGGAAYHAVYNVHVPKEHKALVAEKVAEFGLENWAEALEYWKGRLYNPHNVVGILGKAKDIYEKHNRSQLPVVKEIDPIFLEQE